MSGESFIVNTIPSRFVDRDGEDTHDDSFAWGNMVSNERRHECRSFVGKTMMEFPQPYFNAASNQQHPRMGRQGLTSPATAIMTNNCSQSYSDATATVTPDNSGECVMDEKDLVGLMNEPLPLDDESELQRERQMYARKARETVLDRMVPPPPPVFALSDLAFECSPFRGNKRQFGRARLQQKQSSMSTNKSNSGSFSFGGLADDLEALIPPPPLSGPDTSTFSAFSAFTPASPLPPPPQRPAPQPFAYATDRSASVAHSARSGGTRMTSSNSYLSYLEHALLENEQQLEWVQQQRQSSARLMSDTSFLENTLRGTSINFQKSQFSKPVPQLINDLATTDATVQEDNLPVGGPFLFQLEDLAAEATSVTKGKKCKKHNEWSFRDNRSFSSEDDYFTADQLSDTSSFHSSTSNKAVEQGEKRKSKRKSKEEKSQGQDNEDDQDLQQQQSSTTKRPRHVPPAVKQYYEVTDKDVLFGRGPSVYSHPGNMLLHNEKVKMQAIYLNMNKTDKKQISQKLVDRIHELGGRFLQQEVKSGRWFEVSNGHAREKAAQVLREQFTPEMRREKRRRYKQAMNNMNSSNNSRSSD